MQRMMCKSMIHRATVTDSDLNYEGSFTVDPDLLDAADIREYEHVHVANVTNGERFETYTILGERGSGQVIINGAAARLVQKGDLVIIMAYASYFDEQLKGFEPKVVFVDGRNRIAADPRQG
jgi:aspartate 1-decarboxylase